MIYCAPYVIQVYAKPLLDGAILVEQGRIIAVGPRQSICANYPSQPITEFPKHILMPGLVNCHTHLELSALANKIPAGIDFIAWLREIVKWRSLMDAEAVKRSIQQGIQRLLATGTTSVGDISNSGLSKKFLDIAGLRGLVFLEVIGFQAESVPLVMSQLDIKLVELISSEGLVEVGISPHAPYSVSPALFAQIRALTAASPDNVYKLSIHLAESQEEENFLAEGSGPFRQMLEGLGKWDESWQVPCCSPVQYMDSLQMLSSNLLAVHLNYLKSQDYQLLAQHQVQAVTCPGSNAWLGHKNLHLQALHEAGVGLALGTDSWASNKDLSLFYEMRMLAKDNPWLEFEEIIKIATMGGAKALGMEGQIGSLTPDKQADIIAVAAPADLNEDSLCQYVVQDVDQAEMVMVAGNVVFEN